jgi:thiamine biosynthesis lipoprotein
VPRFALILGAALLAACPRAGHDYDEQMYALGTLVTLRYYDVDEERATAATAELERLYRDLGKDWYPWHEDGPPGELARINAAIARGESIDVSLPLASLLQRAAEVEQQSGGMFNSGLGALTKLWGFDDVLQENWRPPDAGAIHAALLDRPGAAQLQWNGTTVGSANRALIIDPGGIAKGALLAMSADILRRNGIADGIVDLGGDMIVVGTVHGRAARIGIRDPSGAGPLGWVDANPGEAVVTSGNYERFFDYDGKRYAHVLDPRTGYPAAGTASVTVIHVDPVLADAAATALLVAGADGFDALCGRLGIDQAVLVDARGDLRLTAAMRKRVHWRDH